MPMWSGQESDTLYFGNREPSLDEFFNDPIVRLLLARDGLPLEAARALTERARRQLHQRRPSTGEAN